MSESGQRTGTLQDLADFPAAFQVAAASWSAVVLDRFSWEGARRQANLLPRFISRRWEKRQRTGALQDLADFPAAFQIFL